MVTPYIGEIRLFGGTFAPQSWAMCNGQTMSITQNQALFALIGTTYGGDGVSTFKLPNLQGALPIGQGNGPALTPRTIGQVGGEEQVTLNSSTMAQHNHPYVATTAAATSQTFSGMASAAAPASQYFYTSNTSGATGGTFPANSVTFVGGNQPHENRMPSLCVTYIIALLGVFPTRN